MQKYTAIILSSRDANEFDRIYIMYTKEAGLVRAVARGVRKPAARLAGHLEPATLSEVYVARAKGMGQITSAITLQNFKNIKKDIDKLQKVLAVFRFFSRNFNEGERDKKVFELLQHFLNITDSIKEADFTDKADTADISLEAFWWKLFDFLGKRPEVMKCVRCQKKLFAEQENFFSVKRGGILSKNCNKESGDTFLISENQIKLLRLIFTNPLPSLVKVKISTVDVRGLEKISERYQKYHWG